MISFILRQVPNVFNPLPIMDMLALLAPVLSLIGLGLAIWFLLRQFSDEASYD